MDATMAVPQAGEWIWGPDASTLNQYIDIRQAFTVPSSPAYPITLTISADSHYALYLNGREIPASQYADYPFYQVYDQLDISDRLHPGRNVLGVVGYCQVENSSVYRHGRPRLWFVIQAGPEVLAASGPASWCRRSRDYASGEMERFSGQLSFSFRYDATAYDGWREADYTVLPAAGWQPARVQPAPDRLVPRPIQRLAEYSPLPARVQAQGIFWDTCPTDPCGSRILRAALAHRPLHELSDQSAPCALPLEQGLCLHTQEGDGLYLLLDLGREETGYLYLDLDVADPCEILIGFGEHLEDLRPRTSIGGREFAARYRARAGRQTFVHRFKRAGCRYVQLQMYTHQACVYMAGLRPVRYPVEPTGDFHCSDELHNRIFTVGRHTLALCMHEHYEDCPWREQALYAMDSRNQILAGYYAFRDDGFAQASLRLLALGLREDGLLELCAPARLPLTIPAFSLHFILAVADNLAFAHDLAFVAEMMPVVRCILEAFSAREQDGLVSCFVEGPYWNFYEWQEGLEGQCIVREEHLPLSYDAPLNAWWVMALDSAARLADALGDASLAAAYRETAAAGRAALQRFWQKDRGLFATYLREGDRLEHECALSQALIVCAGGASPEQKVRVLSYLTHPTDPGWLPVTLSSSLYLYDALMQEPEQYGTWMLQDVAKIWGEMLVSGASTFWETAKGSVDFSLAGSLCHGWSAVPVYLYYRYVLGKPLDPAQPVRPVPCGLYDLQERPYSPSAFPDLP